MSKDTRTNKKYYKNYVNLLQVKKMFNIFIYIAKEF